MASKRERVFALGGALLFFVTSFGFSGVVIWESMHNKNTQNASQLTTDPAAQTTDPSAQQTQEGKMQGTKLANFQPVDNVASLQKIDLKQGTGAEVKPGDTVTVNYTGAVAKTGIIFQSSKDFGQPVSFSLSGVIKGWSDGIPGMRVGGTRRLLIPASEAYGANPPSGSGIPANADLVFDVELVKIGK